MDWKQLQKVSIDKGIEWFIQNGSALAVNVVTAIIILIVAKIGISVVIAGLERQLHKAKRVSSLMERFLVNTCRRILWLVAGMIALKQLGIDIGPLIAGLGVTGFIVGFAFQETLGNLAAGFMIALNQPFTLGDFVDLSGHLGVVNETNMMATTLLTPDNKKVIIPNKNVWGSPIVNYSAMDKRRVDLAVGISYDSDIRKAREVLLKAAQGVDKVLSDPPPLVEVLEMGDSSVNLAVRPWANSGDYWAVYFGVNQAIKEALDREGISIPFPQLDVHHFGLAPNPVKN